jgi:beta-phosphoglucomutase family hydrolase
MQLAQKDNKMNHFPCKGAVFDLDGVITQTAKLHFEAWKNTFDEYLKAKCNEKGTRFKPFTRDDYLQFVDGKPRYMGVKDFLETNDIDIPYGDPKDPPDRETICGVGNRKNEHFRSIVAKGGVDIYESTVSFVKALKQRGVKVGVSSSSMNCSYILEKTGLIDLFGTVVDGVVSKEIGLRGKPHPDIFLLACENLKLNASECMMVEDALVGVEAGRNGNFAFVLGVAREGDTEELLAHGADIAVHDVEELSIEQVAQWFTRGVEEDSWHLRYHGYEPENERLRETLTTVGNGYFGSRGCFEGARADEVIHYPGTYIAGVFNKLPSVVYRKTIYNNDFVNCPNWLLIEIQIGGDGFIQVCDQELLEYTHDLNMKEGVMTRSIQFKDGKGRITTIHSERIAGMHNPHLAAICYRIVPENYSEKILLRSSLDGTVINYGVARYRELNSKHLYPISVVKENGGMSLLVRTTTSKVDICMHAKNTVYSGGKRVSVQRTVIKDMGIISEDLVFHAKEKQEYVCEKLVSIYTSRDQDTAGESVGDPEEHARRALLRTKRYDSILKPHRNEWQKLWATADCKIKGDRFSQKVVRLHSYHLLVTASLHNRHIDAGIPARGLHGEAYRGHIFWDEVYILPFYFLHFPEVAKALLMYRYRRLDAARKYARENGYDGAMYPWQTADDGSEETQILHFNPVAGKWGPDLSRLQRHVSIAIAYNIWAYYYITGDLEFIQEYGAEMMLEIARFWASAAQYVKKEDRYHISGVMGPDEFHEKYPDAKKGGLKDNAYTNIMVCWLLHKSVETYEHLPTGVKKKLIDTIHISEEELEKWNDIVRKMSVEITQEGVLSQFAGYMDLLDLDWGTYREKYENIHRLDRILKSEGDSPDRYQVTKQADVLMLFYLLAPGQVRKVLNVMGYDDNTEKELIEHNYDYYIKRTSHGSTLSYVVHCAILKYLDSHKKAMWDWFQHALKSDLHDIQGGTTAEAIHCGVMAGTLDIIFKSFAGVNIFKDYLQIEPNLPSQWQSLSFKITVRGTWIGIEVTRDEVKVFCVKKPVQKLRIRVGEEYYTLNSKPLRIPYHAS